MNMTGIALAAVAAAALAAPLAAQGACDVETRKPTQLASALLYIGKHDQLVKETDRARYIREAVRVLTDKPERIRNEAGRNFLLGQVYVRWLLDAAPRVPLRAKRSELGFVDNPDGEFFLPAAIDEAMGIVEREKPACADSTVRYRNAVFANVLNASIGYFNTRQYDSAIVYANYALEVNARSTLAGNAYQVIAKASQAKGDLTGAITALQMAISRLGTDAASEASRAEATFNLAVLTRDQAMKQQGDARKAGLRSAAGLFKGYLDLAPDGASASTAKAAYARSLQDAGDTALVASIYAEMIANPGKYTALQLFEAGMVSANGQRFEDAARLYEDGLQANPWYRDALFNLANVYFAMHLPEKMAPVVERLRAADPMNPDVLKLAGAVWQERGRQATDAGMKRVAQDSVIAYLEKSSKLPARVSVNRFVLDRESAYAIAGTIQNLGPATATISIAIELVDRDGKTVATLPVSAEGLGPRGSKDFAQQGVAVGAVAWRYVVR